MDFDRKKLKPMWAQFWASHQVSRLTPTHPGCSQAKLPLHQPGFNSISLASTPSAWLQPQQPGFNSISLASTPAAWLQLQQPGFNLRNLTHLTSLQQLTNQTAMPHSLTSHLLSHPPSSSNLLAPNSFSHVSRLLPSSPVCLSPPALLQVPVHCCKGS